MADPVQSMLSALLTGARLTVPDDLPRLFAEHARQLGAEDATVFLADYEQRVLVPLPGDKGADRDELPIDNSLAGWCYRHGDMQRADTDAGRRLWVLILDGLERLGVLELTFSAGADEPDEDAVQAFTALVAELIFAKNVYGDLFHRLRRLRPMTLAAEIASNLLPPSTFGTDRVVLTAMLAPAYRVGGDIFDYAADADTLHFGVFDAMGHGLEAALLATVAVGAYRNSRRSQRTLEVTADAIDTALAGQFGAERFVTGILAELDMASGRLRWSLAGHPAPLLIRNRRVVKTLTAPVGLPFGLGAPRAIAEESLEAGDLLLLFTDGVVEARDANGELFGTDRLADFITRQATADQPLPETMRRLMHAILAHQDSDLQDDATTLLVEWRGGSGERMAP